MSEEREADGPRGPAGFAAGQGESAGSMVGGEAVPSTLATLLQHSLAQGPPPLERRIFVNRSLRLESIEQVGFDLDWTLAAYEREHLDRLAFALTIDRLVEHHGYSERIRRTEFHPEFFSRGLMIDRQEGIVLRMNRHRYVGTAYLGHTRLGREDQLRLYRLDPLHPASERFYHVDSLFELPEVNLFAEIVELRLQGLIPAIPYERIFLDVRQAIDWVHGSGPLKEIILSDIGRFLQRSPEVALALERLALGGRRLFLLTNSEWRYAERVCSYLFDGALPGLDSWRDLFDLVVVQAGKPAFFRQQRPFVPIAADGSEEGEVERPEWGGVYRGGSLTGLMQLLAVPGERVLYVGDHIYGDIVRSKIQSTWRTALVVPELDEEIRRRQALLPDLAQLRDAKRRVGHLGHEMDQLRDALTLLERLAEEGAPASPERVSEVRERFARITQRHREARSVMAFLGGRVESAFNPLWGSLFKQGTNKTLFASQLESFACLYTSRVSNFAYYGTDHYFRVFEDPLAHELEEDLAGEDPPEPRAEGEGASS